MQGPLSSEEYADRAVDCLKKIEPRFNDLVGQQGDLLQLLEEAEAAGWTRQEAAYALETLLAANAMMEPDLNADEEAVQEARKKPI